MGYDPCYGPHYRSRRGPRIDTKVHPIELHLSFHRPHDLQKWLHMASAVKILAPRFKRIVDIDSSPAEETGIQNTLSVFNDAP